MIHVHTPVSKTPTAMRHPLTVSVLLLKVCELKRFALRCPRGASPSQLCPTPGVARLPKLTSIGLKGLAMRPIVEA